MQGIMVTAPKPLIAFECYITYEKKNEITCEYQREKSKKGLILNIRKKFVYKK